jgi:hypothetical protein
MAVHGLEEADQANAPTMDAPPPEPESFVEAARLQAAVREELAAILASSSFRTSRKSCEFLQYVVQVTLDGRIDSLKERSIGLDLLGRDVSYDPSSDATVRVRANEVRKRLKAFYSSQLPAKGYRIELPTGSYSPRFIPTPALESFFDAAAPKVPTKPREVVAAEQGLDIDPFGTVRMARPALFALFLCALFLRQQIMSGDPYHQFWDKRLQGKTVMLLSLDEAPDSGVTNGDVAQAILPMVWLAGRYDLRPLVRPREIENSDRQDVLAGNAVIVHSAEATQPALEADKRLRYLISGSQGSYRLVDSLQPGSKEFVPDRSAVLTVLPEQPATLWIAGTDWASESRLAEMISSKVNFPSQLTRETEAGHVVQAVWMSDPSPHLVIYSHQP